MTFSVAFPKETGDEVWQTAKRITSIKGETVGAVIFRALGEYNAQNRHLLDAVERAKKENRNGA